MGDSWQFRYVVDVGATTGRAAFLAEGAPLLAVRGNRPVGADVGTASNPLAVSGPYVVLDFGLPEDWDTWALTGRVRIIRKSYEFSRDIDDPSNSLGTLVADLDLSADLGSIARDAYDPDYLRVIDQGSFGGTGETWYYTVFFEANDGVDDVWFFSPANGHSRAWVLSNETTSTVGDALYEQKSHAERVDDYRSGDLALQRLLQAFGRMFDEVRESAYRILRKRYDVETVDAALIPYIDWLLAWPTNYELSETYRRIETRQAATLWKSKGTASALELVLQTVTGWDVEVTEGWKWSLRSWDGTGRPTLDPLSPPADWNEPTDGVWADLVEALPFQLTFDNTNPLMGASRGTTADRVCYTFSDEEVVETGVGWGWQNPNGLLISLTEIEGVSRPLSLTIVRKILRMAPLFAAHFAAFAVSVERLDGETYLPLIDGSEYYVDNLISSEAYQALLDAGEGDYPSTPDLRHLTTWPHPNLWDSEANTTDDNATSTHYFRTWHGYLDYSHDGLPPDIPFDPASTAVGTDNALHGVVARGDNVWVAGEEGGIAGYVTRYVYDGAALSEAQQVRVSTDAAFTGFTAAPQHELGAISYGGGFLWGQIGSAATVAWLARIDLDTLAVDAAWDLNALLGLVTGEAVAFAGQSGTDTELWYGTAVSLYLLNITAADAVSVATTYPLTTGGGALVDWGQPQGIAQLPGDEDLFALSVNAGSGFSGTVDGIWLCTLRLGQVMPIQGWEIAGAGSQPEGFSVIDYTDGEIDLVHAEASAVERYQLPKTPQLAVRDLIRPKTSLLYFMPQEWNALDYEFVVPALATTTGTPAYVTAGKLPGAHIHGATEYDGSAGEFHTLGTNLFNAGVNDLWAIGIWFRIYAVVATVASNLAICGKADAGSTAYTNGILLRTIGTGFNPLVGDSSSQVANTLYTPASGTVRDGLWRLGVIQHRGSGVFDTWLQDAAGQTHTPMSTVGFTGVGMGAQPWRIGTPINSSVSAFEGSTWGHFIAQIKDADSLLTNDDIQQLWDYTQA